jgi:hypothetical protein
MPSPVRVTAACLIVIAAFLLAFLPAHAAMRWQAGQRPVLLAHSTESESARAFLALCRGPGAIELRIGADAYVGKGEGEPVSLIFAGGGRSATLRGVSKKSDDFGMTGGRELVTEVSTDDPLFAVLLAGKPVTITGSLKKPIVLDGKSAKPAVAKFLVACSRL